MKNKKNGILCIYFVCFMIIYTAVVFNAGKSQHAANLEKSEKLKNDLYSYLSEDISQEIIDQKVLDTIKQLGKEDCTKVVDMLIYYGYQLSASNQLSEDNIATLKLALDGREVNYEKIEDEQLKSTAEALKKKHVILKYVNESFLYDIDYDFYFTTYKDYIDDAYYNILKFYADEKSEDYIIPSENKIVLDVVEKRMTNLYELREKYSKTDFYDLINSAYVFYKTVYFGVNDEIYIFDKTTIKNEVYESYNAYMNQTKDIDFKNFLNNLLVEYSNNNKQLSEEIANDINTFIGIDNYENNSSEAS